MDIQIKHREPDRSKDVHSIIVDWCMRRSPGYTAKDAAQAIDKLYKEESKEIESVIINKFGHQFYELGLDTGDGNKCLVIRQKGTGSPIMYKEEFTAVYLSITANRKPDGEVRGYGKR